MIKRIKAAYNSLTTLGTKLAIQSYIRERRIEGEVWFRQSMCPHPENARFTRRRMIEEILFEVEECTKCQKVFWP